MEWRPVPGFEEFYKVSRDGRVWSCHTDQILTPYLNTSRARECDRYFRVDLRSDGDRRQAYVHHIVLEAWVSDRPEGAHAHHINSDHHDNRLENLEWVNGCDHIEHHNGKTEDQDSVLAPEEEAPF